MRPLLLDKTDLSALQTLRKFAEQHPVTLNEMKRIVSGQTPPVGDREGFSCQVSVGFRIVYSIEEHPKQAFRHASFSVDTVGKMPNHRAVQELMNHLGFILPLEKCLVKIENKFAVNVLEPYNE